MISSRVRGYRIPVFHLRSTLPRRITGTRVHAILLQPPNRLNCPINPFLPVRASSSPSCSPLGVGRYVCSNDAKLVIIIAQRNENAAVLEQVGVQETQSDGTDARVQTPAPLSSHVLSV